MGFRDARGSLSYALRFRLYSEAVFDILLRDLLRKSKEESKLGRLLAVIELPKKLFRDLSPRKDDDAAYSTTDAPLPFLRHLVATISTTPGDLLMRISADSHEGYPLIRAVHASHIPLVRFLLSHGANPSLKCALAVRIAIQKRDLELVKTLVERDAEEDSMSQIIATQKRKTTAKRRRLEDRVEVTAAMLQLAVEVDARDIVEYLMDKGTRPDMRILRRMQLLGLV